MAMLKISKSAARPPPLTAVRSSIRSSSAACSFQHASFTWHMGGLKSTRSPFVLARASEDQNKSGMDYVESNEAFPEPEADMWDDEKFELFGQIIKFAVPIAVVGVVLVGGFASSQYNEGATQYMTSPSPDASAIIVDAKEVEAARAAAAAAIGQ